MPKIVFNVFTGNFDYVLRPGEFARTGVPLIGTIGGGNKVFTTPTNFLHNSKVSIAVYVNGRRLTEGRDYLPSESGGIGTGYDTVTLEFAPKGAPGNPDYVSADYLET